MSHTLKEAADAALASNAVAQQEAEQSVARRSDTSSAVANIGPAALSNDGVREAAERRTNWLVTAAIILCIGGCSWLTFTQSSTEQALTALITAPSGNDGLWQAPHRIPFIQSQTWLPTSTMPVAMNLDQASMQASKQLAWGNAAATWLQQELAMCTYVDLAGDKRWVPHERTAEITTALNELQQALAPEVPSAQATVEALRQTLNHSLPTALEVADGLVSVGLTPEAADLLSRFIHHSYGSEPNLSSRLRNESVPASVQLQSFILNRPEIIISTGGRHETLTGGKGFGTLLRFSDDWAPTPYENWKLLEFRVEQ